MLPDGEHGTAEARKPYYWGSTAGSVGGFSRSGPPAQAVQAYARFADVWDALAILRQIMAGQTYQDFPAAHSTVT